MLSNSQLLTITSPNAANDIQTISMVVLIGLYMFAPKDMRCAYVPYLSGVLLTKWSFIMV
jgi:hypothetical protein